MEKVKEEPRHLSFTAVPHIFFHEGKGRKHIFQVKLKDNVIVTHTQDFSSDSKVNDPTLGRMPGHISDHK